jgi:hypothetical protein
MKWHQNAPKRPEMGERLRAGLAQTGNDNHAFLIEALPELVPGEMHGDAVVFVERYAKWAEEWEAWKKRQPYTQEHDRYTVRFFDGDPISGHDLCWNGNWWWEHYQCRVRNGADEAELRAMAARFIEALRLHRRACEILRGEP